MIGEKIREARKQKGLTQSDLATALGITTAAISKYETNAVNPPRYQLERIAKALQIDISDISTVHQHTFLDFFDYEDSTFNKLLPLPLQAKGVSNPKINENDLVEICDNYKKAEFGVYDRRSAACQIIALANRSGLLKQAAQLIDEADDEILCKDILKVIHRLNNRGKNKVFEYVSDLLKIKEYNNQRFRMDDIAMPLLESFKDE